MANTFSSYSTSSSGKDELINIKPGGKYQYNFFINADYNLLKGRSLYELDYVSDTFEHDPWKLPSSKYFKKIKFIWLKNNHDNGGKLISFVKED